MKKILIGIISLCIVTMTGFSLYVKNSYESLLSIAQLDAATVRVSYDPSDYSEFYYYNQDITLDDLERNSDIVVEVVCSDLGVQRAYSTLRNCEIKKVIRGKCESESIYIYEPSYVMPYNEIAITNGYINMKENESYILFLKKVNAPKGVDKEYSNGYYLTSPMYGKYQHNYYEELVSDNFDDDVYYDQIEDHNVLLVNEETLALYNSVVKSINIKYY